MAARSDAVPRAGAWGVAAVGALAVMAGLGFGRFSYTILLPSTREGLGLTYTGAGLLGAANLVGYLAGSLVSRIISERIGPRATASASLGLLVLGLAWMSVTQSLTEAMIARSLAGIGGGIVYVQSLGLVAGWFPGPTKGLASGVMHSGNGAGLILTGLGLPLALLTGWRTGWIVLALGTMLVLPLACIYLRSPQPQRTRAAPATVIPTRTPLAVGTARTSLATYGGLYGLFGLSYIIYVTFFAELLRGRGLSIGRTGFVWAVIGALSLASGPVWGGLSDRIGRLRGISVLFGCQAVAYLAFLSASPVALVASAGLFGITAWGIPAIMAAAVGDGGRVEDAMAGFGRITTIMGIGQAAGPVLAGWLADVTGAVNSGLWLSLLAATGGALWSFAAAGLAPGVWLARHRRSKA